MKKIMTILSVAAMCFWFDPALAHADVAGLTPCKDSPAFAKRLKQTVKGLNKRLKNYEADSAPAVALQKKIEDTEARFAAYGKTGLLCGKDGLPHLITDGRWTHAGEVTYPALGFLYVAGWIGWVGRSYLQYGSTKKKPTETEIIIDVPVASQMALNGFMWPIAAWREFTSGRLLVAEEEITVSPR